MRLFLKHNNIVIIVFDWPYNLPPTIIYHRLSENSLVINTYEFDYVHKDKVFYKFLS